METPPLLARIDAGDAVEPALAVAGIDDLLASRAPSIGVEEVDGLHGTVHLHATDPGVGGGEWLVELGPGGLHHRKEHAKGDVAVRAPAADLYRWLWGRRDLGEGFEVFGDEGLARRLREVLTR